MASWTNKMIACALAGVIQCGIGASAVMAAPPPDQDDRRSGMHQGDPRNTPQQNNGIQEKYRAERQRDEQQREEWQRRGREQAERMKNEPPRQDWQWKDRDGWETAHARRMATTGKSAA